MSAFLTFASNKKYSLIIFQSSKLGEAIYCSGWERGVSQIRGVRSTILIVMARAHKPLYFTAGGMYNLTVDSFARVSMKIIA